MTDSPPALPIFFETSLVARTPDGQVLIALFDGSLELGSPPGCVALLLCSSETARTLGSGLKDVTPQAPEEN